MKKISPDDGRRSRTRLALDRRDAKTVLAFEKGAQAYRWTTDRSRPVVKH
ncbi:MAG: hypothetical protein HY552_07310 [Elusimicrobia bacterium]|nr:hypothetical protein [Elusimicrobiota bacterium]